MRPPALGLLDSAEKKKAQARLIKAVEAFNCRVRTGFLSTPFLLGELTEAGGPQAAYRLLLNLEKPGWLYEVTQGATTVWETWEGYAGRGDVGSLNHYSPGAVCQWLFDTCAGIRMAGENHFVVAPVPGGTLTYAEASYHSLYGEVKSRWEKNEEGVKYTVTIPANCTAEINYPDGRQEIVSAGKHTSIKE